MAQHLRESFAAKEELVSLHSPTALRLVSSHLLLDRHTPHRRRTVPLCAHAALVKGV